MFYATERRRIYISQQINIDDIFETNNYGQFKIISESNRRRGRSKCYDIQFIDTKSIRLGLVRTEILNGEIKDYYRPSIAGVGYIGSLIQKDYKVEYSMWKHMLHRCYNPFDENYIWYGKQSVTIDKEWFNFENFVRDIPKVENFNKEKFDARKIELDKDKKQLNLPLDERVYSLDTCCFLTRQENLELSKINKK